jgi:CBS domain-containing protein
VSHTDRLSAQRLQAQTGPPPSSSAEHSPAAALVSNLRAELQRHSPFRQMSAGDVDAFVLAARQTYYAPGEVILSPGQGPVGRLLCLRRGNVSGGPESADAAGSGFLLEAGDLFPVAAWLGQRPVSAPYTAADDCFCFEVPAEAMRALAQRSGALADFLNGRVQRFLTLSKQALKSTFASQALAEQSMEARLGSLQRRTLVACSPQTPVIEVLRLMQQRRVGSVLMLDPSGVVQGILTRHDVLERVALGQPPMDTPVSQLMSHPVHTLDVSHSVQDAVLLMSRHGILHVPVTEQGRVVNMVSERDLFALQRLSLKRLSGTLRSAPDLQTVVSAAPDIRRLARTLMAQGLSARSLTELISHLNDVLTARVVQLVAGKHGLDLGRACWLAFGSEGRSEQTIATDQDNGLVFASDDPDADRPAWLTMASEVNHTLDACGYPLCKGLIMAGQPECCLSPDEWIARFGHWIDHGAPEDLLKANIYFDFRPLTGESSLVEAMRRFVHERASQLPRFTKQMAQNALRNTPRLNWRGALDPQLDGAHEWVDLKLNGTMIFVDAARLYALAHGVDATGTRQRFEAVAEVMRVEERESQTWIGAFEFLQMLRLRVQVDAEHSGDNPNRLDVATLNDIDRRILKESFRAAQRLQQRITLDYMR